MNAVSGRTFFCSWSGGKDSCLALYHAIKNGGVAGRLLTMIEEDGSASRAHGLPADVLEAQAAALGIPLVMRRSSWESYERVFVDAASGFKRDGIDCGVFGDIDLPGHLEWVQRVCSSVNMEAYEPLWQRPRRDLLEEFLDLGFKATIIVVKDDALDRSFLGRTLSREVIASMEESGVDASGEAGEYHTVVTDGPIFGSPVRLVPSGTASHDGYSFVTVSLPR